jgi:hypothetical protein
MEFSLFRESSRGTSVSVDLTQDWGMPGLKNFVVLRVFLMNPSGQFIVTG